MQAARHKNQLRAQYKFIYLSAYLPSFVEKWISRNELNYVINARRQKDAGGGLAADCQ